MAKQKSRGRVALVMIGVLLLCLRFDILRVTVLPVLTAVLGALGVREFHRMARQNGHVFSLPIGWILAAGIVLSGIMPPDDFSRFIPVLLTFSMIGLFMVQMNRYGIPGALAGVSCGGFALLYVALPLALALQVLQIDRLFLFFGLILIWTADSGAYFFGRQFGKHKMAPELSPKKTYEGLVGGIFTCCVVAGLFHWLIPDEAFKYPLTDVLILSALIAVIAPIGDLGESVLKRDSGVKDSGTGLGGHGGVLDRIDSMLFCVPIYYAYLRYLA